VVLPYNEQESLANAKVGDIGVIGRNSLNRPSLKNAQQYQRYLYVVEEYF